MAAAVEEALTGGRRDLDTGWTTYYEGEADYATGLADLETAEREAAEGFESAEQEIREGEDKSDHYEDILGSYLVKLSSQKIGDSASQEAAMLLKLIGDFERISDHSVNILESAEEMLEKELTFSPAAQHEISVLTAAVHEILDLSLQAFQTGDPEIIRSVEPL